LINKTKGMSLIAAIFVMVIFLLLGTTLISILSGDVISAGKQLYHTKAFYAAEAGIEYTMSRLLRNDYDWADNNFTGMGMPFADTDKGYPPSTTPPYPSYTGSARINMVSRDIDGADFTTRVTNAHEGRSGIKDTHWPMTWLWSECILQSNGKASLNAHASLTQRVERYLCPTLNYSMATPMGPINLMFTGGGVMAINYSHPSTAKVISGTTISYGGVVGGVKVDYPNDFPSVGPQWYPLKLEPSDYKKFAKMVVPHDTELIAPYYEGLIYCEGTLHIGSNTAPIKAWRTVIDGSIIAEGDIIIHDQVQVQINANPDSFLPDAYLPAMVAENNIYSDGLGIETLEVTGLVYAGGDKIDLKNWNNTNVNRFDYRGTITVNGMVYCEKEIKLDTSVINLNYLPAVRLTYGVRDTEPTNMNQFNSYGTVNNELRKLAFNESLMHSN